MPKDDLAHKDQVFSPPFVSERIQNGSLTQDEVEALWHEHVRPMDQGGDGDNDMCDQEQPAYFRYAVNQLCSSNDSEEKGKGDDSEEKYEDGDSQKDGGSTEDS